MGSARVMRPSACMDARRSSAGAGISLCLVNAIARLYGTRLTRESANPSAVHRAAHQVLEQGCIFSDPLALQILGQNADLVARETAHHPSRRAMRLFIAARSAIAEVAAQAAVERRGVRQIVVLGAGLDTFAYRSPFAEIVRIFEVDHPATQAWKRRQLRETHISRPANLTFTPVDFETDDLRQRLAASGLDPALRTFFIWLGVVPYLSDDAVFSTLAFIAELLGGGDVVFDYGEPPCALMPETSRNYHRRAKRVAAMGEPFVFSLSTEVLHRRLAQLGFLTVEDMGIHAHLARYLTSESAGQRAAVTRPRRRLGHLAFASTTAD